MVAQTAADFGQTFTGRAAKAIQALKFGRDASGLQLGHILPFSVLGRKKIVPAQAGEQLTGLG